METQGSTISVTLGTGATGSITRKYYEEVSMDKLKSDIQELIQVYDITFGLRNIKKKL